MNTKLPFALSALGLISLAIHQPAAAQDAGPSLNIEITAAGGGILPPQNAVTVDGTPLKVLDGDSPETKYLVFKDEPAYISFKFQIEIPGIGTQTGGFSVEALDRADAEAKFATKYAELLTAINNKTPGTTVTGLLETRVPDGQLSVTTDKYFAVGEQSVAGPSRLNASASGLANSVILTSFADPSQIQSRVQSAQVGADVENAADAALATSGNTVAANATVISQLAAQSIATGESSLAVASLATTTDQTTSTATVEQSEIGVRISNDGTLSGATSVTVDSNALTAAARGNDSTSRLVASGANSGVGGNDAAGAAQGNTYPAPGALTILGDLQATGVQRLDQQSNVSASITSSTLGLTDAAGAGTVDSISGGISVSGGSATAVADGNRLALELTDALSGSDVDSTAYGLQTVNDTGITAAASATVGVDVTTVTGSALVVSDNRTQSSATGNRATASVSARPDGASDSLVADVEQFVRAETRDVNIESTAADNRIGLSGVTTATGVSSNVADNLLTAIATGNDQSTAADLGAGVQAGAAAIGGNQTLGVVAGDLTLSATVSNSRIGTVATTDALSQTTVSGNTAIGQVLGNNGQQQVAAFAGSREAALNVSQDQQAIGSATQLLTFAADVNGLGIGASATTLAAPQLTVSGNRAAGLITVNRNSQSLGAQSGGSNASGSTAVTATQTADSISAGARLTDLRLGVIDAGTTLSADPARAAAEITVSGNTVDAQTELNRSVQTLDSASGNFEGTVVLGATQNANTAAGGVSDVVAGLTRAGVGLYGATEAIDIVDGRLNLTVSDNSLASQAQANQAQAQFGAVSGVVNLASPTDRLGVSLTQTADNVDTRAQNLDTGLGLVESNPTAALFGSNTDNVSLNVNGNTLQALSRRNNAGVVLGAVSGQLSQGTVGSEVSQTSGAGASLAQNSGVYVGVTAAPTAADLGLGNARASTGLAVTGNSLRADAADNLSTIVGGGVNGTIGGSARIGATVSQSSTGATVDANNNLVSLGANLLNGGTVGNGTGSTSISVADNSLVAVAAANNSTASLGGVSGSIAAGGTAGIDTTQTLDSLVTATSADINAGITDANIGNVAGAGATSLSVSANGITTVASGNDSRVVDLGESAANIEGTLGATTTQTLNSSASLAASNGGLRIGAVGIGELGTEGVAALSVDSNVATTSATGNNSEVTGAVSGTLTGQVALSATQVINGSTGGISAVSGTTDNTIGVQAATLGANTSASVAGNTVRSAVAGNRVLNNLDGAAFSSATGAIALSATQSLTGNAAATSGDLYSAVSNTTVGVIGGDGSVLPAASVSGNRLQATTVANDSSRLLNNLSGNFNAATTAVTASDSQTTDSAVLVAQVADSSIGSRLFSDSAVPTALAVNGNSVVAQAIANSSNQQIQLNGVSTTGGPLTSLNAAQSLLNTTVTATISSVTVGFSTAGLSTPGSYTGGAVTSGNSLNASAIGNQSSLVRSGR
ncbi:S-layer family protein [Stagnimonas aquatica]|uniref:S-layer family protein n=1 Tax=Stagnimonas aquatica TaxID=2689987 RepID=A0A3N0VKM8_9GAMM|nr:S-layer family protein [Stagnimonas aquatica]ROH93285.1 S-layer family protein [Stagnimonas aquatica]